MYKKMNIALIMTLVLGFVYSINNIAVSDTNQNIRIAVIDTAKIISNSSEIKTIKSEREAKMKEMQSILEKAQEEISKETDAAKAVEIEEKYRNEINKQKIALDKGYNQKISALNTKIHTAVADKAKSMNYDLVLPKDIVFWGGDDITAEVEKAVK